LAGLLDGLREALVAYEEAVDAVERGAWMARIEDGAFPDAMYWTSAGRTVVRGVDLWPRTLARKERARRDLDVALAAVQEAAGEDLDPSLLDALIDRARDEAEAGRGVGAMEDYAVEHGGGVSNESYARAQQNLDRAIRAREDAQTQILVQAEQSSRTAPPPPTPAARSARARTPRRSTRPRADAGVSTATGTADGDPPASGDAPPPGLSPAAVLAALRTADLSTLTAIRDALGDVPRPRFVPSESQRALWSYLLASPVARSLDLLALDLRRAKRTVLRDFRVLEARGIVRRVEGGGLLVLPLDGNQRGTKGELTGAPPACSVVSR
jgi:hypothetical protein